MLFVCFQPWSFTPEAGPPFNTTVNTTTTTTAAAVTASPSLLPPPNLSGSMNNFSQDEASLPWASPLSASLPLHDSRLEDDAGSKLSSSNLLDSCL